MWSKSYVFVRALYPHQTVGSASLPTQWNHLPHPVSGRDPGREDTPGIGGPGFEV